MAKRVVAPTGAACEALAILGAQIRVARHERNWTAAELGMRTGVGARTITAIERGAPGVAVGTVLSAATIVGVPLFGADREELARLRFRGQERVALLPSREYHPRDEGRDDDDALDF
ncbi:MAG: helix-turn-helix domain-containing protein [Actinomycetia bacterium]|nr:helix-turn-helix domain-containing protein [Actinomycetes bacterium]